MKKKANWNHGKWEDVIFMAILDGGGMGGETEGGERYRGMGEFEDPRDCSAGKSNVARSWRMYKNAQFTVNVKKCQRCHRLMPSSKCWRPE